MSPLPIVSALPAIDAAIKRRNIQTIGILGTRTVMESRLYGAISSAEIVVPEDEALENAHQSYFEMALTGRATDAQRRALFRSDTTFASYRVPKPSFLAAPIWSLHSRDKIAVFQSSTVPRSMLKRSIKGRSRRRRTQAPLLWRLHYLWPTKQGAPLIFRGLPLDRKRPLHVAHPAGDQKLGKRGVVAVRHWLALLVPWPASLPRLR